jgi:hydrogenase expression/formation protein HypE
MDRIRLDHGAGGRASQDLLAEVFLPRLGNPELKTLNDAAAFASPGSRLALTTDSYVVDPIFFPGGDIGSLAIHGTVNDLSMRGARPMYLSAGFILEEGLPLEDLIRVVDSMASAVAEAEVQVLCGDTKVVGRGQADKIFINTAGVGLIPDGVDVAADKVADGDVLIVSGTIGDHGVAILAGREGLPLKTPVISDSAPLNHLVADILAAAPGAVHTLRDPTRGGLATAVVEVAGSSGLSVELTETWVPIRPEVAGACEVLGLDPLYLANEGKVLVWAEAGAADEILKAMKRHPAGSEAAVIGRAVAGPAGRVFLNTVIGGRRIVDVLTGQQLPRIC